jgi:hypothetical protein
MIRCPRSFCTEGPVPGVLTTDDPPLDAAAPPAIATDTETSALIRRLWNMPA